MPGSDQHQSGGTPRSPGSNTIAKRISYRLYLATAHIESMAFLRVRRKLFEIMLGKKLTNFYVLPYAYIEGYENLTVGRDVSINRSCNLACAGGVEIGDYVSIAHATSIISSNHGYADPTVPIKHQPSNFKPVRIGSNVWISSKVTILPGVSIADGTIVAAGAVVSKSILEPDTIVGGIPARKLKGRFD